MITSTGPVLAATFRGIAWPALIMVTFDFLVVVSYVWLDWRWVAVPEIPLSILGVAMGVVLSFRNNSTYQRWWEARTLWGNIVNYSRTLARQATTMIRPRTGNPDEEVEVLSTRRRIVYHQIAYVHALKRHLRGQDPLQDLGGLLDPHEIHSLSREPNVPVMIQQRMGELLRECFERGWLDSLRWGPLDESLSALANAQGGSERIRNTPFPKQYDFFQRLFVNIYVVLLPLGMVSALGVLTPIGSSLIGILLMLLDQVGRNLEDPFNNTIHDVPLASICQTIEINLRRQLGEMHVPSPTPATHGVLW